MIVHLIKSVTMHSAAFLVMPANSSRTLVVNCQLSTVNYLNSIRVPVVKL